MQAHPPRLRNPLGDFYSPYFGPVTLLLAAVVLIVSVQAGKYVGRQTLSNDGQVVATPAAATSHKAPLTHKPVPKVKATHKPSR